MKTIFKTILTIASFLLITFVNAQNEIDALRYSRLLHGGTARYFAMGGAFSTLGADFSVLSTNPAGIGVYRSSELVISPAFNFAKSEATYLNSTGDDIKYNLNITNFGMVFTGSKGNNDNTSPEWKGIQFGFGVNRLQDFNSRVLIQGLNEYGSILDVYQASAQGKPFNQLNPFDTELAFNTYLIDTLNYVNNYIQAHYGGATQKKAITTSGGMNEMVLTLGGNYDDRLYVGATLGIPFIRYEEFSTYKETDDRDTLPNFKSLTITDDLSTYGTGVNLKLGVIFRITDWVRISGAFHSPTFFSMTDQWQRSMSSDLEGKGKFSDKSPKGKFDYSLMTPMRAIGGIAFVISQYGSVSAEYEFVDYTQARLNEKNVSGSFFDQNNAIRENYTATGNLRVGTEWIVAPFSLRAGYALYGNPFKSGQSDFTEQMISGGVGFREKNYFFDLGFVNSSTGYDYFLYPGVVEASKIKQSKNMFVCTFGLKF